METSGAQLSRWRQFLFWALVVVWFRRVWMHQSMAKGSSVSSEAVEYCREHGISVIAGACPMMYGSGVDFGHACMRWLMGVTGKLPA